MRAGLLLLGVLLLPAFLLLSPPPVSAEGISGAVEPSYSILKEKSEDAGGRETKTESRTFTQRYFLNFVKTPYPNLNFVASGTFEKIKSTLTVDDTASATGEAEEESAFTTKSGLLSLRLNTEIISSGVSFSRREEKLTSSFGNSAPRLMDTYNTNLAWRPEGLPSVSALFTRTDTYDKDRELEDRVSNYLSLALRHDPVKGLELQGSTSVSDTHDKLTDTKSRSTGYSGKAAYTRRFGDNVTAYSSYSYFRQETETIIKGAGEEFLQVFPFFGLSAINDTPALVILESNPALIDTDLTAASGINIGPVPTGADARPRQIGIDFINSTEVNTIFVWVGGELPITVSDRFRWDVYISSDNENWTLWQTVPSAPFGKFFNRFEININNVSARYLKVVTSPLSPTVLLPPGIDVNSFNVTQMQAFLRVTAGDVEGKRTQSSHVYDLNARWQILDSPNLSYNFFFLGSRVDPGAISSYVITNSLSAGHSFNRVFSGSARISREDSKDTERQSANTFSASLTAVPLPTLVHRLILSSRFAETEEGSTNSYSATLNNSAELYQGLNFNLTGGMIISTSETDRRSLSTFITSGLSAIPHQRMGINMYYTQTNSKQSGGGLEDRSTLSRRGDLGVSYRPFDTLYMSASYGISAESDRETTDVQNYALTWSPFQGGDLLFNFTYNETISSPDETIEKTISPSLIWNLRGNAQLQASYQFRESTSPALHTEAKASFISLRVAL